MNIKTAHSVYTQAGTQPIAAEFQYVPLQIASRIPPSLMTVWFSSLDACRLANMKISRDGNGAEAICPASASFTWSWLAYVQ